jgi:hypothetical protein
MALALRHSVIAMDKDPLHLKIAEANVAARGLSANVTTELGDVQEIAAMRCAEAAFIDPARRTSSGNRKFGNYDPPLRWCLQFARKMPTAIKVAPGIDHDTAPARWEIEFVAYGRELKEAVLWSPQFKGLRTRATILPQGDQLEATSDQTQIQCREPGAYLYDPNPAVTRAGLVEDLARNYGLWKIDPMIAFLTGDEAVATPFARTHQVIEAYSREA